MKALDFEDNLEFRAFLSYWKESRLCPFPFQDWLLDQGLELQAEAVTWVLNKNPNLYPYVNLLRNEFGWWKECCELFDCKNFLDQIPDKIFCKIKDPSNGWCNYMFYPSFEKAIIALMDNWE